MWEWFLPRDERPAYRSEIMEGPHGGGGRPFSEDWASWSWSVRVGFVASMIAIFAIFMLAIWAAVSFSSME